MTALLWDQTGERLFEGGVDRAVLYRPDDSPVAWNGLISVSEKPSGSAGTPVYYDGAKYGDLIVPSEYAATLRAYTYPDEFLEFEGTEEVGNGLYLAHQEPKRFGLSYRTMIGNDEEGTGKDYKIHVIYNLLAFPSQKTFQSFNGTDPTVFEWNVTAVPEVVDGYLPTAHLIFDTRKMGPLLVGDIERKLYGDEYNDPELPPISIFVNFIDGWAIIRITDNFDGTWTATGPDDLITMLDATTFQIDGNAVYLDGDTYAISDLTY